MPQCDKIYFDSSVGSKLYIYDPAQPVSSSNPALNTISLPMGHGGLAISEVLGSGNTSLTYYTVVNRQYTYYDLATASWVPTGHYVSDSNAVNLGAGGGYIYNLSGNAGKIYRYDGTANDTLIVTDTQFNAIGAILVQDRPFDLIADCEGNVFLFNSTGFNHAPFLKKYSPGGALLQQWTVVNPIDPLQAISTGFAILEDTLYVGSFGLGASGGNNEIRKATLDNALVTINPTPIIINSLYPGDLATCGDAIKLRPEIIITADPDSLCGPSPVLFRAQTMNGGSNPVYQWYVNGLGVGGNDTFYTYTPNDGDQIYCVYTGQSICSSTGTDTSNVIRMVVSQPVEAGFSYEQPHCEKLDIKFSGIPKSGSYVYNWDFGDGSSGTGETTEHTYGTDGDKTVQLIVLNGACSDTITQVVTVHPMNMFELSNILPTADTVIHYGDTLQLSASGAATYIWTPASRVSKVNIPNPIGYPVESTVFTVVGMDENGCIDSATRRVEIIYPGMPGMPSAFSPNGDGLNDIFKIANGKHFKVTLFRVFNRWGELVFSTNDPEGGWNGTYKNVPAEVGVYYYEVQLESPDHKTIKFKGDVTLIR